MHIAGSVHIHTRLYKAGADAGNVSQMETRGTETGD